MKYFSIIYKLFGSFHIEVFSEHESEKFGKRVAALYLAFEAPSFVGTCSIEARSKVEAAIKAETAFKKDGWEV